MDDHAEPAKPIVKIMCPGLTCRKVLSVPADLRGQVVKCQHCQKLLRVPHGGSVPKAA